MTFSALLLAKEIDEARATGAELFELARRLDAGKLYTTLDAMAFLACVEERFSAAARIAVSADAAHEAHGNVSRRPAENRMQEAVAQILDKELGMAWRDRVESRLDEVAACALGLGYST